MTLSGLKTVTFRLVAQSTQTVYNLRNLKCPQCKLEDYVVLDLLDCNLVKKKNSVALVREQTIPTERPPPVGEVSAKFCG